MTVKEIISEIDHLLDLQIEYHKFGLSLISKNDKKISYIETIREHYYFNFLKGDNKMITEQYRLRFENNLIIESIYNPIDDLIETFQFIKNSLVVKYNLLQNINESVFGDLWDKTKQVAGQAWDKTKQVAGQVGSAVKTGLNKAVDFIKKNGNQCCF